MSDFFYQIVKDAINYRDSEAQAALYNLNLEDMRGWCVGQLDLIGVPAGYFRDCVIMDLFSSDNNFQYKFWQFIQDSCEPEVDDEEN